MDKKPWYSAHILFSLALILMAVFVCLESVRFSLPLLRSGRATWQDMPGLVPIICAVLLILLSLYVIVVSARRGGRLAYFLSREAGRALVSVEAKTVYTVFFLMFLYGFVLFPNLPYIASTFLFMCSFMLVFKAFPLRQIWKNALIALVASVLLYCVFDVLFHANLPKGINWGG